MSETTPAPANRLTAERIITGFYTRLGRPQPEFIWFDDPLSCVPAANRFAPLAFKRPRGGQIPERVWFELEDCVRDLARSTRHVEGFWGGSIVGRPSAEVRQGSAAARLNELQRVCGWWSPREGAVLCSDGPREIRVDALDRLHGERGPACELSAQHKIYAWHGVPVPPDWIERRDTLDPAIALGWHNRRQQEAALQILGWANVITHLAQEVIDADGDPQIGTLLECELPGFGPARFLRVRCGTGRDFVLSVPMSMTTARQANAWTYGLQSNEYQLEARS